ncbi:MAG: amidohydrolase family protein, partial [Nitrospiraceae bacterium]|nr:amidohydrolase family protein [Nitrospiraceae bacterium]
MFDINTKLGPWPYRPVRGLDAYLRAMDELGIIRAAVSALDAVHFLNPQDGNVRLAQEIEGHRDRLTLFAVLRPNFAGALDDLDICVSQYDAKGIVLYPNYHDFALTDPTIEPLMAIAAARGLVVCVQAGLEDPRRQFRPYKTLDVPAEAIGTFARAYPAVSIIALGLKFGQPEQMGEPLPPNLYFDTSNYERL